MSSTTTIYPEELGSPVSPGVPESVASRARYRYSMLALSHAFIDVFPIFFVVLMLPLREKLGLSEGQVKAVYMTTPIFSGLFQPLFAWISDRFNTRAFCPLGILIGSVCIGSIGFAQSFEQLIALQIVGVLATGFYHPISTALAGQTGARGFRHGRAFAVGMFIAAGMVGQTASSLITPQMTAELGLGALVWLVPPGVLLAIAMHLIVRKIPHRADHDSIRVFSVEPGERRKRWGVVASLTVQNALRFTVNVGMFTLFNVWAESKIRDADKASVLSGELIACSTLGMGIGVILAGRLVKRGRERKALVWMSVAGAMAISALGFVGDAVWNASVGDGDPATRTVLGLLPLYVLAIVAPLGYFATFPITASLGQRLLPGHTSIATSLLMGVGWAISSLQVFYATWMLGAKLEDASLLPERDIAMAFVGFAALIVVAGVLAACMRPSVIRSVAEDH
ncbi:MAG: MFS transporter [Phycisphaerales bacterium JB065]